MRRIGLVVTVLWLVPATADAGNGVKPRTPVLWEDVPCMTIVDRSVDAQLHVPYAIPVEDPVEGESVTPDEVDGSRTHQFVAFTREVDPVTYLPSWMNEADVAAAVAKGIIEAGSVGPEEVFDTAKAWTGAWSRITPDDPRLAIAFEVAEAGIDWDTTSLSPGVYHIEGYTYEPQFNVWWPRPGVVKVHDGNADAAGPAIALDQVELVMYRNSTATIAGCIDAPAGTTVEGSWAYALPSMEFAWESFGEAEIDGGTFGIEFPAPEGASGMFLGLRAVATTPNGESYTTYLRALVTVLEADDPEVCDDDNGGGFIGQPGCPSGDDDDGSSSAGGSSTAASTDAGTSTSTADGMTPAAGGESNGCGCMSGSESGRVALHGWLAFAGCVLTARRRRAPY